MGVGDPCILLTRLEDGEPRAYVRSKMGISNVCFPGSGQQRGTWTMSREVLLCSDYGQMYVLATGYCPRYSRGDCYTVSTKYFFHFKSYFRNYR